MDGVTLLRRAREAGLAVAAEGDKLVIRGPRRAEPVVRLLIEHKPEVMAALTPSTAQRAREATQLAVADAESVEGSTSATNPRWWRNLYAERSAHHERGGRRPRAEAEHLAYGQCIARWHQLLNALNARPAPEFSESITRARPT